MICVCLKRNLNYCKLLLAKNLLCMYQCIFSQVKRPVPDYYKQTEVLGCVEMFAYIFSDYVPLHHLYFFYFLKNP